ncbi:MAG TPA: hypothetical protein VJY62_19890 [Bacteroidia bacterium]|nr:hypothetical protein [Bacteroidia bacterium]
MKNKKSLLLIFFSGICLTASGQKDFNLYTQVYPIGDDPNIRLMTSYRSEEKILFEANPTVRFSLYNTFIKGLMNNARHTQAWYISVRPQFRMYTDNSLPVRTPSYRVLLGTQHLFRLPNAKLTGRKEHFLGFSLESGHYSNGQDGCAFSEKFQDESTECDSIYNLINSETDLSSILNRRSGNFSTNLTELIINYRRYAIDDNNKPLKGYSIHLGMVLYHDKFLGIADFGGYSDNDIKIYGRWRYLAGVEYMHVFKKGEGTRISFKENLELIQGAHKHVKPFRSETIFTWYPFIKSKALGFFICYIYGHDNYNFRFIDSGQQACFGISWTQFQPVQLTK